MIHSPTFHRVRVIDSHTGGEPTRVVIDGGPDLGRGSMAERRLVFQEKFDEFRSAVVNEPRGSDVIVGALLCEPVDPMCAAGVIFFNNVGPLWMCGHGTIGLGVTLGYLGRIKAGTHRLETPVGVVTFDYDGANRVSLENVPSYRHAMDVSVYVEGLGCVTGDIAWGGNWFFLVDAMTGIVAASSVVASREPGLDTEHSALSTSYSAFGDQPSAIRHRPGGDQAGGRAPHPHPLPAEPGRGDKAAELSASVPGSSSLVPRPCFDLSDVERLADITKRIRRALQQQGITGADGGEIDHIELFGPPGDAGNHSRNFVLCPGGAYDRSPCGTGTSAKVACLYADGKLKPGDAWRQESILGSVFEGSVRLDGDLIIPRVTGSAFVNAEATLLLDPTDPFQMGIDSRRLAPTPSA